MNESSEQKLTYREIWGIRRKAGYLAVTLRTSMYVFVFLAFLKICYSFYTRNLTFTTKDALILLIPAFIIATVIWFANEIIYKMNHH